MVIGYMRQSIKTNIYLTATVSNKGQTGVALLNVAEL
jgi:hypothetical protein